MMIKLTAIFCLLTVNFFCSAESIRWNSGVVVLRSEEILQGQIAVHQHYNVVLVRQGNEVNVYPAHKVRSLYYYDAENNINRKFITVDQHEHSLSQHRIYEIVLSGEVSVLRKSVSLLANLKDDALGYEYYVYFGGEVVNIRKFRSKIYPRLMQYSGSIEKYVSKNRLRPAFPADVIQIIEYYNKADQDTRVVAAHD